MRFSARHGVSIALLLAGNALAVYAQSHDSLASRVEKIMARPEFAHSNFGIEFYDLESGKVLYSVNSEKLFVPASTTKLLTEGAVLAKLGSGYRFHTPIYRTGPIDKHGTLKGNLILVASGDPNLSNRIQPDGTLAFVDEDHSYQGPALPGDPLAVIKELAEQVKAKGIRKIEGNIYVDASLLPDGAREGGTDVVMSSIIVNDNLIDLVGKPGAKVGQPVELSISPKTSYVHFTNGIKTGTADSKLAFDADDPTTNPDGTLTIALSGNVPLGMKPQTAAVPIPSPTQFATAVLREAIASSGIQIKAKKGEDAVKDFKQFQKFYVAENQVAEHVSPPLSEEVRITLKVSQNLHAGMGPYLLGLLVAKDGKNPLRAGFKVEHKFLADAQLDLSGASQGDGAGGDWADLFSPDFMCHYLAYWKTRPDFQFLFNGLPILGKDGTLAKIQTDNPAAGHVFAKTGTFGSEDKLNSRLMLNGKGLAGYVQTKSGKTLAFAAYVNHTALPEEPEISQKIAGQALGEIAASAYDVSLP
ncbi:MAG TPA: D-alanyl-D-alanine carboxypeptidase/D-alanyl-D-alanine-endopeptidase [Candidatus Acidoferrum sp.]